MKHPCVVLCAFDDWLANQLREMIAERRWALRELRQPLAWVTAAAERRPCAAVIQIDFTADPPVGLSAVTELHRIDPSADIIVVSDTKMSDDDRPIWTAVVFDLGARMVVYPPLTKVLLEDTVSGLLGLRVRGGVPLPFPASPPIDLALGEHEAEA